MDVPADSHDLSSEWEHTLSVDEPLRRIPQPKP